MQKAEEREILLSVRNLEVTFGGRRHPFRAVKNASFDVIITPDAATDSAHTLVAPTTVTLKEGEGKNTKIL